MGLGMCGCSDLKLWSMAVLQAALPRQGCSQHHSSTLNPGMSLACGRACMR